MQNTAQKQQPKKIKHALSVTRAADFPAWYQDVIKGADMAEMSGVRGCMVIKPWGYGIWERIQRLLDDKIKQTGHDNCYFPLFIPLDLFQKEAAHVDGFAKEMAVVTHHRLEQKDGELHLAGELETPLVVRPTSEMVIGQAFAEWIQSYRDLPVLINQWANVVRWEMRPRMFLRTAEFLWQEGHTAHADKDEAMEETTKMLGVYRQVVEDQMLIPLITGRKPDYDRFPGAVDTLCIEAMMQDGKALQAGTSHYLGQNFAKASNIQYQTKDGGLEYVHTTSWGVSTRLIGGLIMTHGDDDGLRLPPQIAPSQIIILPILKGSEQDDAVLAAAKDLKARLEEQTYEGEKIRVRIDDKDVNGAAKKWDWVRKGAPMLVELGPKDLEKGSVALMTRTHVHDKKEFIKTDEFIASAADRLTQIAETIFTEAKASLTQNTVTNLTTFDEFKTYFEGETPGFVRAYWSEDAATEEILKPLKLTVRCIPFDQKGQDGTCILTGKPAKIEAVFARSY